MSLTHLSQREVFRTIVATSYHEWPAYDFTPLYDRSSLGGLEEDVRTLARVWFEHDAHESVEGFVCCLPLAYVEFEAHDRYTGTTRYGMKQLVRAFLLKELHGWEHESALVEYLHRHSSVRKPLDFESVPDQSTLWRTWHRRFTPELRETIATAARSILIQADRAMFPSLVSHLSGRLQRNNTTMKRLLSRRYSAVLKRLQSRNFQWQSTEAPRSYADMAAP